MAVILNVDSHAYWKCLWKKGIKLLRHNSIFLHPRILGLVVLVVETMKRYWRHNWETHEQRNKQVHLDEQSVSSTNEAEIYGSTEVPSGKAWESCIKYACQTSQKRSNVFLAMYCTNYYHTIYMWYAKLFITSMREICFIK